MRLFVALLLCSSAVGSHRFHQRFTEHFLKHLHNNQQHNAFAIGSYFNYTEAGTFGGFMNDHEAVGKKNHHDPIVFVHGNQESALNYSSTATGWNTHIEYLLSQGYSMGQLHGLSHGHRNVSVALGNRFTCEIIQGVRRHIEAVLDYTKADKIDVVSHSMGVTIARAAIMGGTLTFTDETCHLGASLAKKIDTFVGIAGANYGVCYCAIDYLMATNACSHDAFASGLCPVDGLNGDGNAMTAGEYCGHVDASCDNGYSKFLRSLNDRPEAEQRIADFIVSLWSLKDEILGFTNLAWGKRTSHIPSSDLTIEYGNLTHNGIKDLTARHIFELVTLHDINVPSVSHSRRNHRHSTTPRPAPRHIAATEAPKDELDEDEEDE